MKEGHHNLPEASDGISKICSGCFQTSADLTENRQVSRHPGRQPEVRPPESNKEEQWDGFAAGTGLPEFSLKKS
jgi:hypothetical protein